MVWTARDPDTGFGSESGSDARSPLGIATPREIGVRRAGEREQLPGEALAPSERISSEGVLRPMLLRGMWIRSHYGATMPRPDICPCIAGDAGGGGDASTGAAGVAGGAAICACDAGRAELVSRLGLSLALPASDRAVSN